MNTVEVNIIESIRTFIKECPFLKDYLGATRPKVNVDYLGDTETVYSIERVPCNPIIKQYIDGSKMKQEEFIFCSRESYGENVFENLENINFYENFVSWLEEKNRTGDLPILDGNREVEKIEILTPGYAFATDIDKARYQIQLRLIYIERK